MVKPVEMNHGERTMKYSFYVVDDLRLGYDPLGVKGWRSCSFLDWKDALEYYRNLPLSVVKELGITDGEANVGLIRCLPLFQYDVAGEDVFLSDYFLNPLWRDEPLIAEVGHELVNRQNIRFCLLGEQIIPAPKPFPKRLKDKYLWGDRPGDYGSAIKWIYVAGVGWLSPGEFKRRYSTCGEEYRYPQVLHYKVDAVTIKGQYVSLEVTPWEFKKMEYRTKNRVRSNKNKKQEEK